MLADEFVAPHESARSLGAMTSTRPAGGRDPLGAEDR